MSLDWCPVCGRSNTWGCGHDSRQRAAARRHNASEAHQRGRCHHYDHRTCKKGECFKAGIDTSRPGWVPLVAHADAEARYQKEKEDASVQD